MNGVIEEINTTRLMVVDLAVAEGMLIVIAIAGLNISLL
jgi:hypothetical protein